MEQKRGKEEKERAERALVLQENDISIKQCRMQIERQKLMVESADRKVGIEERKTMVILI